MRNNLYDFEIAEIRKALEELARISTKVDNELTAILIDSAINAVICYCSDKKGVKLETRAAN